jgi:hypothetical protein
VECNRLGLAARRTAECNSESMQCIPCNL